MALLLDAEPSGRDAGVEAIARPDLRLPGAADLRRILDDAHGHPRSAPRGANPVDLGHGCIHIHDVLAALAADRGTTAEIEIAALDERAKLVEAVGAKLDTVHIIIRHCTL